MGNFLDDDRFTTQELYDKSVGDDPYNFVFVPDRYITQKMCDRAIDKYPWCFRYVPDWKCVLKQLMQILII